MTLTTRLSTLVFLLISAVAAQSCAQHEEVGTAESYVDNGVAWAYGTVKLGLLEQAPTKPVLVLTRKPGDQTVVTSYGLTGTVETADGTLVGSRDVAYSDLHPERTRMLAYSYQIDATARTDGGDLVDVFALLKKAGRSYLERQRVYLGTAAFAKNENRAKLISADGLKLSLIVDGVYSGQWAMHYADAIQYVSTPWQTLCSRFPSQMPGQAQSNPGQGVGQFQTCKPIPAQQDLCQGDPTKCRPQSPIQKPTEGAGQPTQQPVTELVPVAIEEGVYAMPAGSSESKITFSSATIDVADEEMNAKLCAERFFAVARTVDRETNGACVLKPAPASVKDGKLTCAVTVAFVEARTYLEKVCNVTAAFKGETAGSDERQMVQVLKR